MEFLSFECQRKLLEETVSLTQRNILIELYCKHHFAFVNLVDFYFNKTTKNAILMFIFILVCLPVLFACVAEVAEHYLVHSMQDLAKKFNFSPTLAAITLIALANGSTEIFAQINTGSKENGHLLSLGTSLGGCIYGLTFIVALVALASKEDIVYPWMAITKELLFMCFTVGIITVFGFLGRSGLPFIAAFATCYIIYMVLTIIYEKYYNTTKLELGHEFDDKDTNDMILCQEQDEIRAYESKIVISQEDIVSKRKK